MQRLASRFRTAFCILAIVASSLAMTAAATQRRERADADPECVVSTNMHGGHRQ